MVFAFRPATSQEIPSSNESEKPGDNSGLLEPNYEDEENTDSGNNILQFYTYNTTQVYCFVCETEIRAHSGYLELIKGIWVFVQFYGPPITLSKGFIGLPKNSAVNSKF